MINFELKCVVNFEFISFENPINVGIDLKREISE